MKKISRKSKNNKSQNHSGPAEMDFSYFSPIEVKVYNNFEKAIKAFRSLVQSEKVLSNFKEKQAYEKPSMKRRRKITENIKRCLENEIKQKKILSGEYEREKIKKQAIKDKRRKERNDRIANGR
jgi:ribosomal protein S21